MGNALSSHLRYPPAPLLRGGGENGCGFAAVLIYPLRRGRGTKDGGSNPPYPLCPKGGQKGFAPLCGAIFYKRGAKRRNLIPLPLFRKKGCRRSGGVFEPSSPVLAFPTKWGRWRPQAPDEVRAFIAAAQSPSAPTSPLPLHLRAKSRRFAAVALRNAPAGAAALRGGL